MVHAVCLDRKSSFHGRYSLLNTGKNIRKRVMKLSEKFRRKIFINPEIKILHYIPVIYYERKHSRILRYHAEIVRSGNYGMLPLKNVAGKHAYVPPG